MNAGALNSRCAFKEHQANRNTIKFLWTDRACCHVGGATMLAVACWSVLTLIVQQPAKRGPIHGRHVTYIFRPRRWPADVFDEAARLAKWEVDPRNPGDGLHKSAFERFEARRFFQRFDTQKIAD